MRLDRPKCVIIGRSHWHLPLYVDALTARTDLTVVDDVDSADITIADRADFAVVLGEHARMPAIANRLIDAGVPMVLEKPGAIHLDQLQDLARNAREAGVAVTVPLVHRQSPLSEFLAGVGEVQTFSTVYLVGPPSRYPAAGSPWMLDPQASGGGVLANLGPHFVDLFQSLTQSTPSRVNAVVTDAIHGGRVEDHAALLLQTATGKTGTIDIGYVAPRFAGKRTAQFTVTGTRGMAYVGPDRLGVSIGGDGVTATHRVDIDTDHYYDRYLERVVGSWDLGFPGLPSVDELVAVMAVIRSAYRSADGTREEMPWAT